VIGNNLTASNSLSTTNVFVSNGLDVGPGVLGSNVVVFSNISGGSNVFVMDSNGRIGIGKTNPSTALDVTGTVTATTFSGSAASLTGFPTLNQNTTGTAAGLSATLALASGGTGATTAQAAINALAGAVTSAQYLRGDGTNVVMAAISASDVPPLNQNTTGTAAGLSTTLALASGGTGQTTKVMAFDALSPMTTLGDLIYGGASGTGTRLAPNSTATLKFMSQTSSTPSWVTIISDRSSDGLIQPWCSRNLWKFYSNPRQ
jgi:hypothetical protein